MKYIPKTYQKRAIELIRREPNMALFFDMGLGKTSIVLTRISEYLKTTTKKVLIIAPKFVALHTWVEEMNKWDHLKHLISVTKICIGTNTYRKNAFSENNKIYIVNRENVVWLVENINLKDYGMLIIDELSSFKSTNPLVIINKYGKKLRLIGSKRFIALNQIRDKFKYIYGLTGTPSPNNFLELWPQFKLVYGDKSPFSKNFYAFRNKYYYAASNGFTWIERKGTTLKILEAIKGYSVSLKAEEVLKMPKLIYNDIYIPLDNKSYNFYLDMLYQFYVDLEEDTIDAENVTIKLMQLASGFIYDENKKIHHVHSKLLEVLSELKEFISDNILLFYNFKAEEKFIKDYFPNSRKLQTIKDFDDWNSGKISFALAHPASIGYGINLQQGGHTIIWYGLNWSLELTDQAIHRLYRQGQTSKVTVHRLIAKNTIHEKIKLYLQRKLTKQNLLLEAVKMIKKKL